MDDQVYPIGHPNIWIGAEVDDYCPSLDSAFGLWQTTCHPPPNLLHPVLPLTMHGKLYFSLCSQCIREVKTKEGVEGPCFHSKSQRALQGVWFTGKKEIHVCVCGALLDLSLCRGAEAGSETRLCGGASDGGVGLATLYEIRESNNFHF